MLGDIQGYAIIRKNSTSGVSVAPMEDFETKPCRVMEFAVDGGAMLINMQGTAIGIFDKCDIERQFKCENVGDILCEPGLSDIEKLLYCSKVHNRKGGYAPILKHMVIASSLQKGEFYDYVLWAKQ
jgi:hypothetical protein